MKFLIKKQNKTNLRYFANDFFFFLIIRLLLKKIEHHVHDGEHFEQ